MRLKHLTLCVLSLSLGACAQHVTKSTAGQQQPLGERAASALNTMFDTSSYDLQGQFSIQAQPGSKAAAGASDAAGQQPALDPDVKKQLDQAIKAQKIQLSAKEKSQLYAAIARQQDPYAAMLGREGARAGMAESMINLLNDLQFSYDASVHYRQKMAALNLNLKYQKPTLLVQAQLPMVVDFNNFRLYANYFAFMPFMVNRDSQASFAYIDFSKYKDDFNKVDFKLLANYLKQMNALPYALAAPDQVTAAALTEQDKQLGVHSKIRYQGTLESLLLQMSLFELVNTPYYSAHIIGQAQQAEEAAAPAAEAEAADIAEAEDASAENGLETAAYESSERVSELVQAQAHGATDHGGEHEAADAAQEGDADEAEMAADEACASSAACDAASDAETASSSGEPESGAESEDENAYALSEEACEALINTAKVPAGQFTLCREWYGLNLFEPAAAQEQDGGESAGQAEQSALQKLTPVFIEYQSEQLTDVQSFKQLWQKHDAEIQQALKAEQSSPMPIIMDIGLDKAGRLQTFDYDVLKKDEKLGQFRFISTNQISNYGKAKPIDRKLLKDAKSIEEVTKGSLMEKFSKGLLSALGPDAAAAAEAGDAKSMDDYLHKIALDTYKRTGSWLKAYQAVFAVYAPISQSDLSRHYAAAELNEIAEVYAYHFNEDLPKLQGAALARLNKLAAKHQLKHSDSFDDIGYTVSRTVNEAVKEYQEQQQWAKRIKQHKTRQAVFAQYYAETFAQEYSLSDEQKRLLPKPAQVFAQAFADDLQGRLSEKSLQNLPEDGADLFDDAIYRIAYKDVVKHMPK